jgi:hypothetical protein
LADTTHLSTWTAGVARPLGNMQPPTKTQIDALTHLVVLADGPATPEQLGIAFRERLEEISEIMHLLLDAYDYTQHSLDKS